VLNVYCGLYWARFTVLLHSVVYLASQQQGSVFFSEVSSICRLVLEFRDDSTASSRCLLKDSQRKRRNSSGWHTWIHRSENCERNHVLVSHGIVLDCDSNHGRLPSLRISRSWTKMAILYSEELSVFRNSRRTHHCSRNNIGVNRHNEWIWFSDILEEFSELLGYLLDHDTVRLFLSDNTKVALQNNRW